VISVVPTGKMPRRHSGRAICTPGRSSVAVAVQSAASLKRTVQDAVALALVKMVRLPGAMIAGG